MTTADLLRKLQMVEDDGGPVRVKTLQKCLPATGIFHHVEIPPYGVAGDLGAIDRIAKGEELRFWLRLEHALKADLIARGYLPEFRYFGPDHVYLILWKSHRSAVGGAGPTELEALLDAWGHASRASRFGTMYAP